MRNLIALTLLGTLAAQAGAVPAESRRFTPYFDAHMAQGAFLPSKGDFFTGADVGANVGLLTKLTEKHSVFGMYALGFAGQGFRFQDTEEFASKSLSHAFNFEHRWQLRPTLRIRPGIAYSKNFTRTAAGEIWGEGLYDSKSIGGQLAVDYMFDLLGEQTVVTGQWLLRDIDFPNYTDIIREFQGLSANSELAGGLKDSKLNELSVFVVRGKAFARMRYQIQSFDNEKVVESTGLYGGTAQKDKKFMLGGGIEARLWIFEAVPEINLAWHRSNQNFLLFQSVTDPSPQFAANYYDYNELTLGLPVYMNLTKKWALSGGLDYQRRSYGSRLARSAQNQFTGDTQANNMITLTAGFRKKVNDVSALTLTYSSVVASSNNKFERYLPYNYTGQGIALGYSLTY